MHTNLHIRAATEDDFEAVRSLIEGRLMAEYGVPSFDAERMRNKWATDGFVLAADAWVAEQDGVLAGYADVLYATAEEIFVSIVVEPHENAAAICDQLRDVAEKRARQHPEKPAKLKCRVSDLNEPLMAILSHARYARYLTFLMMETVLDGPPERSRWADGITVRNFIPGQDDEATYVVDEAASADKGYYTALTFEEWKQRMNVGGKGFDPNLWFLACSAEEIVGVALNYVQPDGAAGWIDHLGVARGWRQQGIGKALMLESFGAFYRRGVKTIKLNVDAGSLTNAHRLYANVGMQTVQQYHWYEKGV